MAPDRRDSSLSNTLWK